MKFNRLIFCLLAIAYFSIFVSCADDDDMNEEPNFNTERWQQEFAAFKSGLKVANDEGELFEITLNTSSSPQSETGRAIDRQDVEFYLYTKFHRILPQRLESNVTVLQQSNYDPSKPTFFITHGWKSDKDSKACTLIRDAYLGYRDGNVIVVDWSPIGMNGFYFPSAYRVPEVGERVADMIKFLQRERFLSFNQTTLVGHSLGAHVMGIAGDKTQGQVEHIIGLDPAWPAFMFAPRGEQITAGDAKYVEIIHTDASFLGTSEVRGHTDYFVNNGWPQPGCGLDLFHSCGHSRAYEIFAQSIGSRRPFVALECNSPFDIVFDECFGLGIALVGEIMKNPREQRVFYLQTNGQSPYALKSLAAYLWRKHIGLRLVKLSGPDS